MRKNVRIVFCLMLVTVMLLPLAACSLYADELDLKLTMLTWQEVTEEKGMPSYSYKATDMTFLMADEKANLFDMCGGKLAFDVQADYKGPADPGQRRLISMDGSDVAELAFNKEDWDEMREEYKSVSDFSQIEALAVDDNGDIRVLTLEKGKNHENNGFMENVLYRVLWSGEIVERHSVDLEGQYSRELHMGANGNAYLPRKSGVDKYVVTVVEPDGYYYELAIEGNILNSAVVRTADGQAAVVTPRYIDSYGETRLEVSVDIIDAQQRAWGAKAVVDGSNFELTGRVDGVNGFGRNDVCFADFRNLYGYDMETGEVDILLNWEESGIYADRFLSQVLTDEERMAVIY